MKRKKKITSGDFTSAVLRVEYNRERLQEFEQGTEMLAYYIPDLKLTREEESVLEGIQSRLYNLIKADETIILNYHKQQS